MQAGPPCLWRATDITRVGIKSLGYESLEAMWADYTVMALVRNPYDRAGSSYDYILGRREVCCCSGRRHSGPLSSSRPRPRGLGFILAVVCSIFDAANEDACAEVVEVAAKGSAGTAAARTHGTDHGSSWDLPQQPDASIHVPRQHDWGAALACTLDADWRC